MNIIRTTHPEFPWRYERDTVHLVRGLPHEVTAEIRDKDGTLYSRIHWGHLFIYAGYQFDGCTCAVDFTRALPGCGAHDALLQMLAVYPGLFDEQIAHDALRDIHTTSSFSLAWLYHFAVSGWPRKLYKRYSK